MSRICRLAAGAIACLLATSSSVSAKDMDCGGVDVCGLVVLETGLGSGVYSHPNPSVHGLWPEVDPYGNSQCIAPSESSDDPTSIYPCYDTNGEGLLGMAPLEFEQHEWETHGVCAGVKDQKDFFTQLCNLVANPLSVLQGNTGSLDDAENAIESAGYEIFNVDTSNAQIELPACLNRQTGQWIITPVSNFTTACGGSSKAASFF